VIKAKGTTIDLIRNRVPDVDDDYQHEAALVIELLNPVIVHGYARSQ